MLLEIFSDPLLSIPLFSKSVQKLQLERMQFPKQGNKTLDLLFGKSKKKKKREEEIRLLNGFGMKVMKAEVICLALEQVWYCSKNVLQLSAARTTCRD